MLEGTRQGGVKLRCSPLGERLRLNSQDFERDEGAQRHCSLLAEMLRSNSHLFEQGQEYGAKRRCSPRAKICHSNLLDFEEGLTRNIEVKGYVEWMHHFLLHYRDRDCFAVD